MQDFHSQGSIVELLLSPNYTNMTIIIELPLLSDGWKLNEYKKPEDLSSGDLKRLKHNTETQTAAF